MAPKNPTLKKAQNLLIQARIYRYLGILFALAGLGLFTFLHATLLEGKIENLLTNPMVIVFSSVPFLPALVLSILAAKYEKQCHEMLEKHRQEKR